MRILSFLLVSFCLLFSASLTQEQLELAKAAGYSESQINSKLNSTSTKNQEKTQQVISNNIVEKQNLFTETSNNTGVEKEKKPETIKKVKRYGALFFNNKNKLNPYSIPTPSNYNLNFGDKISLSIYGSVNQDFDLAIDNNGNVTIPQVGELGLIGLTFNDAKDLIVSESKKAYPNSTNILVDILEYSSIQVTISGFVNAPGLYNLSSFSTIKDALIASGGILENGSYRNIYLKRDGEIKKVFDLYQLVRYGNNSSDIMLENGDIILVKPISKEVVLTGDVNYSASFELKKGESFRDLLNYAAGFKPSANINAIKLKRYENSSLKVYTLNKNELYKKRPKSGDEVHIYSVSSLGSKLVTIKGNVVAPGEREIPKNKKLSSLLQSELDQFGSKGYFKNDTNYSYAAVINDNKINSFNLQSVLDKKSDILLKAGDEVVIYKNDQLQERPYVFADGIVVDKSKQKYNFYEGMKASDLFDIVKFKSDTKNEAGARKPIQIDKSKIQISRIEDGLKKAFLVSGDDLENFTLKKFDNIEFFEYSMVNNTNIATIKGEIFIPGNYDITKTTTLKEIINLAGGFTKKALLSKFEIARYETKHDERERIILSLNLRTALEENILIKPDDEITIFPIANWSEKKYIELKGLVKFPGRYPIEEGEKLSSVLKRAGGFRKEAFLDGALFTREDIKIIEQKSMDDQLDRLKSKVFKMGLDANTSDSSKATSATEMVAMLEYLEKESAQNKPLGRISLELFSNIEDFKQSSYDITLKDKDVLYVPSANDTVSVVGEVLNKSTFVYDPDLSAQEYIEKAGGLTSEADEDSIFVIKANGEAKKLENNVFFSGQNIDLSRGDTIVVPLYMDAISDISFAKDVTQILYQIAITAASLKTIGSL